MGIIIFIKMLKKIINNKTLFSRSAMLMRNGVVTPIAAPKMQQMLPMSVMSNHIAARGFYYPDANHHHLNQEPHVLAKRIIRCVGERLRHIDHNRWDGVPITYKTNWNSENDEICIKTCVLVHDA